jgi:dTMP kinase
MTRAQRKGAFIVLEGLDGAGTSTQMQRLAASLRSSGHRVTATGEPSDLPIGQLIRRALRRRLPGRARGQTLTHQALALLFAADRLDHLHQQILPALRKGEVVLCDRYLLSSLVYQGLTTRPAWVSQINRLAVLPDLTLFIDVDPRTAAARRAKRGKEAELFEDEQMQRKVAARYRRVIRNRRRRERIISIDGTKSIEEVTAQALKWIDRRTGFA